ESSRILSCLRLQKCWLIFVESGEYDTLITPFLTEVLVVVSRRKLESKEVVEYSQKSAYVITEVKVNCIWYWWF
ncbi:hypothetical protein GIB67_037213, partial [Kingdonia uniflora]